MDEHTPIKLNKSSVEFSDRLSSACHSDPERTNGTIFLGVAIKRARQKAEVNRCDLAKILGVEADWLVLLENGLVQSQDLADEFLYRVAQLLKVNAVTLKLLARVNVAAVKNECETVRSEELRVLCDNGSNLARTDLLVDSADLEPTIPHLCL